jgi:hypothetical protein
MSESLYKISSEYQSRLNELDENTDMESFTEWLNKATPDLHNKILAVAAYTKELQAKELAINSLILELEYRQGKLDQRANKLRDDILYSMNLNGIKKVEGVEFDVSVRNNKSRVIIDDESLIPVQFVNFVEKFTSEKKISKDLLYEALKSGEVRGCHLEESISLQIKS